MVGIVLLVKRPLSAILILAALTALSIGLAVSARWLLGWLFDGVNATVAAAIVAAAATTVVSVLGVTLGRYLERRDQIELELRQRKIPIYIDFVEGIMAMFADVKRTGAPTLPKTGKPKAAFDLVAFFERINPKLMIWASNDVVSKWSRFRRGADKTPPTEYLFMMEDLLAAIRTDLGHRGQLPKGDLLGTYINDIEDFLSK